VEAVNDQVSHDTVEAVRHSKDNMEERRAKYTGKWLTIKREVNN